MTTALIEFLKARLDEDEQLARAAAGQGGERWRYEQWAERDGDSIKPDQILSLGNRVVDVDVPVCLRGDLQAEFEQLERDLAQAPPRRMGPSAFPGVYCGSVFVDRAVIPDGAVRSADRSRWPFTVPAVGQLIDEPLPFRVPVTFLVGDNGSGKSTLVEALAEGFGLDAYGGKAGRRYAPRAESERTPLGEVLKLDLTAAGSRMVRGPRLRKKGFFLRAETAFQMTERLGGRAGYWDEDTAAMSHGEGFLAMFRTMMTEPGFYVMDEPESALSFAASLQLVALMHELGQSGAQVVCATHSPILASTPRADVVEIGEWGFRRSSWHELELVDNWRRYLEAPQAYLRYLIGEQAQR